MSSIQDGRFRRRVDHAGKRYGYLVAVADIGSKSGSRLWKVRCDCGKELVVKSYDLGPARKRQSCGCKNITIGDKTRLHGMSKHPAHGVWMSMKNRCYRKKDPQYKNYGGRGIKVSRKWKNSFVAFWEDMGPTYVRGLTIERKNNNKGYNKANCCWATRLEQARNKRKRRKQ